MERRKFIAAAVPTVGLVSAPTIVRAQEKIVWRLQSAWSKGMESQYHADLFAEKVNKMAGGRLEIKSLTAGSIVGGLDVFDAVDDGAIEASHAISSYWIGKESNAPMFAAIPLGMDALQYTMWFYQSDGIDLWNQMYEKYDFGITLPCGLNTAEDFLWSHKKITSLDDFNGIKIRTVGYWGDIITKLGARVVTLPGGEIYNALDRKILDAAEFANPSADYVAGLHQVCKYVHVPGVHQPTTVSELIINKKAWNGLDDELKEIVKEAAKATTLESWGHCIVEDDKALKKFQEHGTEIVRLSTEFIDSMRKVANEYYAEKIEKDPSFKTIFDSQQEIIKIHDNWAKYMVPPKAGEGA